MSIKVTLELDKELNQFDAWINGQKMKTESETVRYLTGQEPGIAYLTWHAADEPGTRFAITLTNAVRNTDKKNKFSRGIPKSQLVGGGIEKIKIG